MALCCGGIGILSDASERKLIEFWGREKIELGGAWVVAIQFEQVAFPIQGDDLAGQIFRKS